MFLQMIDLIEEQEELNKKKFEKLLRGLRDDMQDYTQAVHRLAYAVESNKTKKTKRDNGT